MNQKKAKFNIVDLVVLLVLAAGIAFVAMRMFGGSEPAPGGADADSQLYRVTFTAESVPAAVGDALEIGAVTENNVRNVDLGTLVDFTVGESIIYTTDSEGQVVQTTKPGWVSLELVCELSGIQEPTGLHVGEFMLNIGHYMTIRAGNTEIPVVIVDIQPVSGQ